MDKNIKNTPIPEYESILSRTRRTMTASNIWNYIAVPATITTGLFLSTAWVGLWAALPQLARATITLAFASQGLIAIFKSCGNKVIFTDRRTAAKNLDLRLGDPQDEPMRAINRTLPEESPEKDYAPWNRHREKLWQEWGGQVTVPKPDIDFSDRKHKVLYAVAFCTAVSGFIAGDQRMDRLMDMFNFAAATPPAASTQPLAQEPETDTANTEIQETAPLEVRAWITPPPRIFSTGVLYLTDGNQGEENLSAHRNSTLKIEIRNHPAAVRLNGEKIEPIEAPLTSHLSTHYEVTLPQGDYAIQVEGGPSWRVLVTPDEAPNVDLHDVATDSIDPSALKLRYHAADDFGIINKSVRIKLKDHPDGGSGHALPSSELPTINIAPPIPGQ